MAPAAPYSVPLQPDVATQLNILGGTVLLLAVPPALVLGFDQQTFQVGQKFKGLKMIPPGTHFLSYCQPSRNGELASYTGTFISLAEGEVMVMRWDPSIEALTDLADADEAARYTLGVKRFDFDAGLAPYNLSAYAAWQRLSGHITPPVIEKVQPMPQAWFSITAEADSNHARQQTKAEQQLNHQLSQQEGNAPAVLGPEQGGEAASDLSAHMQNLSTNSHASSPQTSHHGPVNGSADSHLTSSHPLSQQQARRQPGTTESASDEGNRSLPGASPPQAGQSLPSSAAPTAESGANHQPEAVSSRQGLARDGVAGRCRYSKLARLVKAHGLTPQQLTECNLDRSKQLQGLLHARWGGQESCLVAELQWAFLTFLLCQSLEGFGQWKGLLHLILSCTSALQQRPAFFAQACAALRHQLVHGMSQAQKVASTDEDQADGQSLLGTFVTDELMAGGFLRQLLQPFLEEVLLSAPGQASKQLHAEASRLKSFVQEAFGWTPGLQELRSQAPGIAPYADAEEGDDEAPVIVDLEEAYAL